MMAYAKQTKMTVQEIDNELRLLNLKMDELRLQTKTINEQFARALSRQTALLKENLERKLKEMAGSGQKPWDLLLAFTIGEYNYKYLQAAMQDLSPAGWVTNSGYNPETMQYCLEIRLNEKSKGKLGQVEQQLMTVVPHILAHKETGERAFRLMEPGLSENGVHYIHEKGGKWEIRVTRYSRTSVLQAFPDLKTLLEFVQDNMSFYPGRSDDQDDDDHWD
jgi:hypothetical protein